MEKPLSPRVWSIHFLLVLSLAGLGQFFLAQKDLSWTLWLGLGLFLLSLPLLFKILRPIPYLKDSFSANLSPKSEWLLFSFIFIIAFFFRVYKLQQFPDGIFSDRAEVANGALRILREHWWPFFEVFSRQVPDLWIYYLTAIWFKLFGSSPDLFSYFDVVLAFAGLPFVYWAFRQISGAPTALFSLFLLAAMRWNFVFARKINFEIQMIFFMFVALSFLLYGFGKKRRWAFLLSGTFLAFGFYSYQAFKAFPFYLLACCIFEIWEKPKEVEKNTKNLLVFFLVVVVLVSPLLVWMVEKGSLGRRESEVSILTTIRKENSLRPVFRNIVDGAEIFNRRYDTNSQSNFAGRRMLDDLTGTLFLLAFAYGVSRIREKPYFYGVMGIGVMTLPAFLSENGGHAGRMLGVTPFVAYLCALLIMELKSRLDWVSKSFRWPGWIVRGILFCFLGLVALTNFQDYFQRQVLDPACLNDFSWAETKAGQIIAGRADRNEFYLGQYFYGHPTVKYLGYSKWNHVHLLDPSHPPAITSFPAGQGACFLLDELKMGVLNFLKRAYPGGKIESFQNPLGRVPLYVYEISSEGLKFHPATAQVQQGLYGVYRHFDQGGEAPFLKRLDPVINFTFKDLPLTQSPLFIKWTGRFLAPQTGFYDFLIITYETSQAQMVIDVNQKTEFVPHPSARFKLRAGWHDLELTFQKDDAPIAAVNLLWKKPGQEKFEFIPNEAFGKTGMSNQPVKRSGPRIKAL